MTDNLTEQVLNLFHLNDKQRAAAKERGKAVVVTAGAGSGKTSTLVARYAYLLAEGTKPRRIAAITFTKKAAQEMRSRIRAKLMEMQDQATDETQQSFWANLSAQMDSARIGTIHSLCSEIIRKHPAEAGVDPRFDMIDEGLAEAIRHQVVDDTVAGLVEEERFLPLLFKIPAKDLNKLLKELLDNRLDALQAFKLEVDNQTRLLEELKTRMATPEIRDLIDELRELSPQELQMEGGDLMVEMVRNLLGCWLLAEDALKNEEPTECAFHLFEARRNYLGRNVGKGGGSIKLIIAELQKLFDVTLDPLTGGAKPGKEPSIEAEEQFEQLFPLLREAFDRVHQAFRAQLDQRQALDFDDLEDLAHRLLQRPDVREHWQNELEAIMVDEYQDTNTRQRDIVNALAGNRGCLFIVGDMRQSIYRFRGADVTVFREEQERVKQNNGLLIDLDLTYRAHEPLLDATGDLLSDVIGTEADPARKYFVPYTPLVAYKKKPEHPVHQPHVEFIIGTAADTDAARPLAAQALAARLWQLKQEGQITEWHEVVLLFRASSGFAAYEEALADVQIPFVTVAGRGFYDRPEIRDLLNILRAIADPLDNLAFAGLLRSPAFGLTDAALFQLSQTNLPYLRALQRDLSCLTDSDQACARRVLSTVNKLNPLVDRIPTAVLLKRVVDDLDYRAILATADYSLENNLAIKAEGRLWRNLDKLLSDTQLSQAVNVREYLDLLQTINDAGAREGEASAEATGSVRLMTIHRAKGLEFPVVVLADAGRSKPPNKAKSFLSDELGVTFELEPAPMLYRLAENLDKDQGKCEDLRLLYVALTRAQAKLIISGHATSNSNGELALPGWGKALNDAFGLPSADFASHVNQPFETQTKNGHPVRALFMQSKAPAIGVNATTITSDSIQTENSLFLYQPIEKTEMPDELEREELRSWHATLADERVSGKVLGRIVHKALQRWLFPGDPLLNDLLESEAWEAGFAAEAPRREIISRANKLLSRLHENSLWSAVSKSSERYSELPYSYMLNGKLENRVIDLLYRGADGWHIVDFKSDPIHAILEKERLTRIYSAQVRRYKGIVSTKLGIPVKAELCFLDDQGEISMVEV